MGKTVGKCTAPRHRLMLSKTTARKTCPLPRRPIFTEMEKLLLVASSVDEVPPKLPSETEQTKTKNSREKKDLFSWYHDLRLLYEYKLVHGDGK